MNKRPNGSIADPKLFSLLSNMIRIREVEERMSDLVLEEEIKCPCHLYSGEEAIAVGLCTHLTPEDYIFGGHRSHGHYLVKGGDMKALFAEVLGKETGCSRGRGGSMHLIDPDNGFLGSAPIVAGTISLAMGAALASKIRKNDSVTVSFFGDGATGEGVLAETLNFAALKKLPLIFACENNLYSTHMPIHKIRGESDIVELAEPYGILGFQVDGNDVLEVYRTASNAIQECRRGNGPVFIEFLTYRQRGHVGPDDNIQGTHTDIRPTEEVEAWMKKDPITRLEKYLLENSLASQQYLDEIHRTAKHEVEEALTFARNSPFPKQEELHHYVYAE